MPQLLTGDSYLAPADKALLRRLGVSGEVGATGDVNYGETSGIAFTVPACVTA